MSFEEVLGQGPAKELMRGAIARGRLGHSYLFSGPDGVGKTLLAEELAKALFCRGPEPHPCDQCPDCHMVEHERHPDLMLVEPEGGSREIKLAQIRGEREAGEIGGVIRFLTLAPVQSRYRVVIMRDAERMTGEAANALLKTLEEPAEFGLLVLTTSRPRALFETIRSRCQQVRFLPLQPDQVLKILSGRPEMIDEDAAAVARLADGSAGRALYLIESGAVSLYRQLIGRILTLPEGDPFALADEVLEWMGPPQGKQEPRRERLREFLRLMQYAYRDLMFLRVGGDAASLADTHGADLLARVAPRFTPLRLLRIQEAIWTARYQIDANAALDLLVQALFGQLAGLQRAA